MKFLWILDCFYCFKFMVNKVLCTAEQVRLAQVGLAEAVVKPGIIIIL